VDTPGFWPGKAQEQSGLLRYGSNLLIAYSKATTLKITVVLRQAIGGAYIAMNSHGLGADAVLAWNNAKIAVLGETSASAVTEDVKTVDSDLDAAVACGVIRKIIAPCETRRCIAEILNQKG
jgi:propionyl-CoA carboxylase beta chain